MLVQWGTGYDRQQEVQHVVHDGLGSAEKSTTRMELATDRAKHTVARSESPKPRPRHMALATIDSKLINTKSSTQTTLEETGTESQCAPSAAALAEAKRFCRALSCAAVRR
jgi:hypothetical protein